jgi:methyl-accepting chemotaxis protein
LILTAIVSYVGWSGISNIVEDADKADDTNRIAKLMLEIRRQEKNLIIRKDNKYIETVNKGINDLKKQTDKTKTKFKDQEDIKVMDDILDAIGKYEKAFSRLVEAVAAGKSMTREDGDKLINAVDLELAETGRPIEGLCKKALEKEKKDMLATMEWSDMLMISGALIAIVLWPRALLSRPLGWKRLPPRSKRWHP